MRRLAVFVPLVFACVRSFHGLGPVPPVMTQPAFLGDASGVYRVTSVSFPTIAVGTEMLLLVVNDQFLMSIQRRHQDGIEVAFAGTVTTDARGIGTSQAIGTFSQMNFGTLQLPATFAFAFDAISIQANPADLAKALGRDPCVENGGLCTMVLQKLCDFDSALSGIYQMNVEKTAESGDCSAATDITGDRTWALATVNSTGGASVASINGGTLELGLSLFFDRTTQSFSTDFVLPAGTDVWTNAQPFSADLDLQGDTVTLRSTSFTRVLASGCTQSFSVSGTRQRGVQPGISCPTETRADCPASLAGCPAPPVGVSVSYRITYQTSANASDAAFDCADSSCETIVSANAIKDSTSQAIAAGGCPQGQTVLLAAGDVLPNSGGEHTLTLSCAPFPACTLFGGGSNGNTASSGELCLNGDVVFSSNSGCASVACRAHGSDCPTLLNCQSLGTALGPVSIDPSGCATALCPLNESQGAVRAALVGNQALLGKFKITGFTPPPAPVTQGGPTPTHVPIVAAGANGDCAPVDLAALAYPCPIGSLDSHDVCNTSTPENAFPPTPQLAYYRGSSGGVCLGLFDQHLGQLLPGTGNCQSTQDYCCVASPSGVQAQLGLGCRAKAALGQPVLVAVTTWGATASVTVFGGPSRNNVLTLTAEKFSSPLALPFEIDFGAEPSYPLMLSSGGCTFTASGTSATTASVGTTTFITCQ